MRNKYIDLCFNGIFHKCKLAKKEKMVFPEYRFVASSDAVSDRKFYYVYMDKEGALFACLIMDLNNIANDDKEGDHK